MKIKARFLRWCHLMRWMWRGHRAVTIRNGWRTEVVACTCDKEWR